MNHMKTKKVGIITFHRALNYGAVLQAYALSTYIDQLGINCEIINYYCPKIESDYKPIYFSLNYHHFRRMFHKALNFHNTIKKRKAFEAFITKYLNISSVKYKPENISIANYEYDCFITGSDQVWDYRCAGFDENYFLTFVMDSKQKNSYGASFRLMELPEDLKKLYYIRLHDFNHISCREEAGAAMIQKILNRKVEVVVDPVMLLSSNEWLRICSDLKKTGYILAYTISESQAVKDVARQIANRCGKKIIVLGAKSAGFGENVEFINNNGPDDFVSYISNAECVVTNSFHGALFSLLLHKYVWIDNQNIMAGNARLNNLMQLLSIENPSVLELCSVLRQNMNQRNSLFNWEKIDKMVEKYRNQSDQYLRSVLGLIER